MNAFYPTTYLLLLIHLTCACGAEYPKDSIRFLEQNPVIDGQLDKELEDLNAREFNFIWQFNNPVTDTIPLTYRMAYTATHLYVYLEAQSDQVIYRRRGYVNGDGFMLLLGLPQKDSLTNEYYDLYFSASEDPNYWAKEYIASYNFQANHRKKFSDATTSQVKSSQGVSGFEALIAWEDIPPYHPWFLDEMGYNLYFAKAIGDTITNGYAVVEDEGIWDEEIPRRNFAPMSFYFPKKSKQQILLAMVPKRNYRLGEKLQLKTASIGPQQEDIAMRLSLTHTKTGTSRAKNWTQTVQQTFEQEQWEWDFEELPLGKYQLVVQTKQDTLFETDLLVFPSVDFSILTQKIQENPFQLSMGTVNTLMFQLKEIQNAFENLPEYESGAEILTAWENLERNFEKFHTGKDPFGDIKKPYRRAFKSQYDETYQPYTLKLPENYDPEKKYPLMVFLHGSGQDEQGLLNRPRSNGKFIELAPLGRDIFRAFSSDSSQKDIIEALEDVVAHFSVDTQRIIIGGFSMGGYGALRTYYEHPELYKGVAVFAGHPDLANYWGVEGEHPNFLDTSTHEIFIQVPVFIYHGKKDGAIPVQLMERLSKSFQQAGIQVTERIVDEKGHEYPDSHTNERYFRWLDRVIGG